MSRHVLCQVVCQEKHSAVASKQRLQFQNTFQEVVDTSVTAREVTHRSEPGINGKLIAHPEPGKSNS